MTIEPTPRSKKMTFLMTQETYDKLCMCSKAIGESQGEIVNRLLHDYFQTHPDCLELGAQLMEMERDRRKRLEAPKPKKLTRDVILRHLNQDEWMFLSQIKESLASDGYEPRTASSLLVQMYQKGILERKIPEGKGPQSRYYDVKYRLAKAGGGSHELPRHRRPHREGREGHGVEAGGMSIEWTSFICDGCGRKAFQDYDEYIVNGEGRRLCPKCADNVLATERVFMDHVPGCVDAPHHLTFYSTWEDLEEKLRRNPNMADRRIGCSNVTMMTAMLLTVFEEDGEVRWWVLGTAYDIPGEPPWPHWKKIVRELGGRI